MGMGNDVVLADGRTLHVYDTGGGDLPVLWHHGTPNTGEPPEPLFTAADRLGIRWIGYDRPGYGTSTAVPDRTVASAAADSAAVADACGLDRFAVMGHSGGGPHALACAALLPDRVTAAVCVAGLSPYPAAGSGPDPTDGAGPDPAGPGPDLADGFDWFAGMAEGGVASLRAAVAGRAAKERHAAAEGPAADIGFLPADWAALDTDWSWFHRIVPAALTNGPGPLVDDDLAFVRPWGFDLAAVTAPVLLLHGGGDRMVPSAHSTRLAGLLPHAELRVVPGEGHISVLHHAPAALQWLRAAQSSPRRVVM